MKFLLQTKLFGFARLSLLFFVGLSGNVSAQTVPDRHFVYWPFINREFNINLENLFASDTSDHLSGSLAVQNTDNNSVAGMQLVGTLIIGVMKLAWIKTPDKQVYELGFGQRIPGSVLQIDQILADSVVLVNIKKCKMDTDCDPRLMLELNQLR